MSMPPNYPRRQTRGAGRGKRCASGLRGHDGLHDAADDHVPADREADDPQGLAGLGDLRLLRLLSGRLVGVVTRSDLITLLAAKIRSQDMP